MTRERMPPVDVAAERAVLGAMLIAPQVAGNVFAILRGDPCDIFYENANARVYEAMLSLYREDKPIDVLTVKQRLFTMGALDKVGGVPFIGELSGEVPTSANADYYASIVMDKATLRKSIQLGTRMIAEAFENPANVKDYLDTTEAALFRLADNRPMSAIEPITDLLAPVVAKIESTRGNGSGVTGIAAGFKPLDDLTAGFQPSDMVVLAARPSVGKTAFALNVARQCAVDDRKGVLIFSLEMSRDQLVQRMLCIQGRVNQLRLRTGFLADHEFTKIQQASNDLRGAPIHIDDTPGLTIMELRAKARRHVARNPCSLIIIDYLQLMSAEARGESRQTEIAEISRRVKSIARELNVPVLALSQLNRESERDGDGRPKLSQLRESGAIEQDADVVMMLWRPKKEGEGQGAVMREVNLLLAKQRNGPTGEVNFLFDHSTQRFNIPASENERREPERTHASASARTGTDDYGIDDDGLAF